MRIGDFFSVAGPVDALWLMIGIYPGLIGILFALSGNPVSLRAGRLAFVVALFLLARGLLLVAGYGITGAGDGIAFAGAGTVVLLLLLLQRYWLLRTSAEEFCSRMEFAGRGLLMETSKAAPGLVLMQTGRQQQEIWYRELLPRLLLVCLPSGRKQGKVSLLLMWLGKVYPSPIPHPRIYLKGKRQ